MNSQKMRSSAAKDSQLQQAEPFHILSRIWRGPSIRCGAISLCVCLCGSARGFQRASELPSAIYANTESIFQFIIQDFNY